MVSPGCTPAPPDCAAPDVFCVGLVTEVGRVDDRAANQAAWEGIQQSQSDGFSDITAKIETVDSRDYEENMAVFAESGYDVIVTVGPLMSAATVSLAVQYPRVYFIGADQRPPEDQESLSNLVWLVFPEDRLGFLAGAMAAAMSQTHQVGAVAGSEVNPAMKLYGEGFTEGALYINPEVIATVSYHNEVGIGESLDDPEWGATTATSMIDVGADVIFGVGGSTGTGAIEAAAERDAYVIGADFDQYLSLPEAGAHMLTSAIKNLAPGVEDLLQAAREAQSSKGAFRNGIYLGEIGFAPYHELAGIIPANVIQQMVALPEALRSGKIHMGEPATPP
jgi:basic membrane protein A